MSTFILSPLAVCCPNSLSRLHDFIWTVIRREEWGVNINGHGHNYMWICQSKEMRATRPLPKSRDKVLVHPLSFANPIIKGSIMVRNSLSSTKYHQLSSLLSFSTRLWSLPSFPLNVPLLILPSTLLEAQVYMASSSHVINGPWDRKIVG